MKKKLLVVLSSVLAGVGLVGTTLAAWAVTDNANPFGVKITPGTLTADTVDTLVLEWGDTTEFVDISGLGHGADYAQNLQVGVKSTASTGNLGGDFTMTLSEYHNEHVEAKLIDNIVVEAYSNSERTAAISGLKLDSTVTTHTVTQHVDVTNGVEKTIYFKVYIPNTVTLENFNKMHDDIVYLQIDWAKPSTLTDVVDATTVYYYTASGTPKIYAWTDLPNNETAVNAAFPGEDMTPLAGHTGYFTYVLKHSFENVIFSVGEYQTDDISVVDGGNFAIASTPFYNNGAWTTVPIFNTDEVEYYLVGSMNNWSANANFLGDADENGVYHWTAQGGSTLQFKVFDKTNNIYYSYSEIGGGDNNCSYGENVEIDIYFHPGKKLTAAGAYDAENGNMYIANVAHA